MGLSPREAQVLWKAVRVVLDSIEWPGGIDLDPEILYRDSVPIAPSIK